MHKLSEPAILYFGTPVVVISTVNEDGTYNLAPISSAFWLGRHCIIGMGAASKTLANLMRTKECVLNLPSVNEVAYVDRLALTTGANPVPDRKRQRGYRYEPDKFGVSGFTPAMSVTVSAPRVQECPVHLEASVVSLHPMGGEGESERWRLVHIELKIQKIHIEESILMDGHTNRIDPDKWRPLIMSFQHFYGLGEKVHPSTLAQIPESMYAAVSTVGR